MLQPNAAHLVAQGQEEVIMVVMMGAKQLIGLLDQIAVHADLIGAGLQQGGAIGNHV